MKHTIFASTACPCCPSTTDLRISAGSAVTDFDIHDIDIDRIGCEHDREMRDWLRTPAGYAWLRVEVDCYIEDTLAGRVRGRQLR